MKIVWEAEDMVPGRRVRKKHSNEVWIIGFDPASIGVENEFLYLVSLSDGMLAVKNSSQASLAEEFNSSGYFPIELLESKMYQLSQEQQG